MENKFTQKAQRAFTLALGYAQEFGHTYIGSEHLLLGLLEERDSVAARMLLKRGIIHSKIKIFATSTTVVRPVAESVVSDSTV